MSENKNNSNDSDLFKAFVGDINKLSTTTVEHEKDKPKVRIKKSSASYAGKASNKHFTDNDSFFAFHVTKKDRKLITAGKVKFEASLDLHGCTVAQSEQQLARFIADCQTHQIFHAIVVHGQGHHSAHGSVLKPAVLSWLSTCDAIDAVCPAQQRDGSHGASYILINHTD